MIFSPVSITSELRRLKEAGGNKSHSLIGDALKLLKQSEEKDKALLERLKAPNYETPSPLTLLKYDPEKLFSDKEIRELCATYRLRFLDSNYFKNDFPYDAIAEVNKFEKENGVQIEKFKMIAPPDMFRLEDRCKKDPLLFAQVADNSYYLIHQWGTDMAWYRRLLVWPLKNLYTFAYFMLALSVVLTFLVPIDWIIRNETNIEQIVYYRIAFFAHTVIFLLGFSLFLGMTFRKNFSSLEWDNQCFN